MRSNCNSSYKWSVSKGNRSEDEMFSMRGANDSSERQKIQRKYKKKVEKKVTSPLYHHHLSRSEAKKKHIVISLNGL